MARAELLAGDVLAELALETLALASSFGDSCRCECRIDVVFQLDLVDLVVDRTEAVVVGQRSPAGLLHDL